MTIVLLLAVEIITALQKSVGIFEALKVDGILGASVSEKLERTHKIGI